VTLSSTPSSERVLHFNPVPSDETRDLLSDTTRINCQSNSLAGRSQRRSLAVKNDSRNVFDNGWLQDVGHCPNATVS
jgi:hypothetical protein